MQITSLEHVTPGATLGEAIYGANGQPLLFAGVSLSAAYIERLAAIGVPAVYVREPDTADIEVPQPITAEARGRAVQNLARAFETVSGMSGELRQASVETIQAHLRSERFVSTIRAAGSESIGALASDVDGFLEQLMNREVLAGLNSIKTHDTYTFQHSIDVTIMGIVLARRLGWNRHRTKAFAMGCMLHDIGKIFIEPAILTKPGRLTEDEFNRIKAHPAVGHSILRAFSSSLGCLAPIVAHQHHEKQDGTGYPCRLAGNNRLGRNEPGLIHDFGAVCAVADVYDALASHRPYRDPLAPDKVVKMIRGMARTHLNRVAVEVFAMSVAPYPVCTRVRVLDGRYAGYEGVICELHQHHLARPRVRLLAAPGGLRIAPIEIDLRVEADVNVESVCLQTTPGNAPASLRAAA